MMRILSVFGFIPKVVALRMLDRVDHILSDIGDIGAQVFDQLFHIFPFGVFVGRAGIKNNRKLKAPCRAADIFLIDVKKRTDHSGLGPA